MAENTLGGVNVGLLLLAGISVGITYLHQNTGWAALLVFNRWLRWILFALLFSLIVHFFSDPKPMSLWPMMAVGFLIYLLLETMYNWLAIKSLSDSDMALFPTFRQNIQGDEWPAHRKFLKVKDWLREHDFAHRQSIKAELLEGVYLRSCIYENTAGTVRLQILFVPQRGGNLSMGYIFSSRTSSHRLITDNLSMPFGGFYPQYWNLARRPLTRSLERLYRYHRKRLKTIEEPLIRWEQEPLSDLNSQQRELEQLNMREGFLVPPHQQDEYGKITGEGRYRIWKEVWLLNYFGVSNTYLKKT